jgi:hypothetical protein
LAHFLVELRPTYNFFLSPSLIIIDLLLYIQLTLATCRRYEEQGRLDCCICGGGGIPSAHRSQKWLDGDSQQPECNDLMEEIEDITLNKFKETNKGMADILKKTTAMSTLALNMFLVCKLY